MRTVFEGADMSRHNSQRSHARPGPSTPAWEQQQQQQQHHATSNNRRTSNLFTGTAPLTTQEIVNAFVLERYSRHNPTATTTITANANANLSNSSNNNNVAQTQMSTFGGVSHSPHILPSSSRTAATNNYNNNYTMSTAPDSRSWSISTTSTPVARVGGGRSFPETKEQSNWIHLSTPNHHLTLTLKLCFRPETQADLDGCRPLLFIQTGNEVLESLGLDRASVRSSKLRGVVKGSMIGFRYTSSSSSSAPSSLGPTPRSSLSESHKFQIKFKTLNDCGQCSSLLSSWIECQSVVPQSFSSTQLATTDIATTAASASTSSQTLVQSSQDTDVNMAPPPLPSPSPHLSQVFHNNNSYSMRFGGTQPWSQHTTTDTPSPSPYSASFFPQSPAPVSVSIPVHVNGEELTQILRSAASNSALLPHTTPTTTSMLLPPQHQHQQQQQRNRQARLSITPQSASQFTPMAMAMPATSNSSSMTASLTAHMSSMAPSDCGVRSSVNASCQQRNIEINEGSFHSNINVNNNDSTGISTTNNDDLSALLNLPNAKLQEDIDIIIHDPLFQDLLLKVDQLLRGPISKR